MGLFSNKKDKEIDRLRKSNASKDREIKRLEKLCHEKDSYFDAMISDGLRHGSKLASKHMRDKKDYLNGK